MTTVICDRCKKKYGGAQEMDEVYYPAVKYLIDKRDNLFIALCNVCYYFAYKNSKDYKFFIEINQEKYLNYQVLK